MQVLFTTEFDCELCKQNIKVPVVGDVSVVISSEDRPEAAEWAKHFHWTDNHRVCAVCGKYVKSEDLQVAVNDGKIIIHDDYTDEYKKVNLGDSFGHLLIVHKSCVTPSD